MLFSSNVFMSRTLRGLWINVVLVFVLKFNNAASSQVQHGNTVKFSGDFEEFLKDLGAMVYKKKTVLSTTDFRFNERYTTVAYKNHRRSQNVYNTEKNLLQDALMMKLVSYYEDKYKLSHLEPTTTERITVCTRYPSNIFAVPNNDAFPSNVLLPGNVGFPSNPNSVALPSSVNNRYNVESFDVIGNRLPNAVTMPRNRRMEVELPRRIDLDLPTYEEFPEVVIL